MRLSYESDLNFVWLTRTRIVFGLNTADDAGLEVASLGGTRALLVTDKLLRAHTDVVARVEKALGKACVAVFDGVEADSGLHICNAGADVGRRAAADVIVSVGGGSVIDTGKAIAILLKEGGELSQYEGFQLLTRPQTPHLVIPTTAGTGSEVTYVAVIKDHDRKQKLLFGSHYLIPDTAILDPTVTAGLPKGLTAATGMDALSHAIESMHTQLHEPMADALALHAVRLIRCHLPQAVANGHDLVARGQMMLAATLAGQAFGNAQVGVVHALAHTLGAHFGVHHGLANAICLPHGIRFNMEVAAPQYAMIADAFGIDTKGLSDAAAAASLADAVHEFNLTIGLPTRLRDVGIPEAALPALAEATLYDGSVVYNQRMITDSADLLELYRQIY